MNESNKKARTMQIDWEKKLKDNTCFIATLTLYMIQFHDETNGIAIKNKKTTKTFEKWLKTQKSGVILLKEMKQREKKIHEV